MVLLSNPLKVRWCFIDVYIIIFALVYVWTRQILFVLSNVKHELAATRFLPFFPDYLVKEKARVFFQCAVTLYFCTESSY